MTQISVLILEQGGKRLVPGGDLSEFAIAGNWENVIDGAPGASLGTVTFAAGCMDETLIRLIEPWYHELRIMLDDAVVFEGPIHTFAAPVHRNARASISAWDVSGHSEIRYVRDQFDWSTGATCSTIIAALTKSAFQGGPAWAGQIPDLNILPYMNVRPVSTVIKRQNGILTTVGPFPIPIVGTPATLTYAEGDRPLTDPHELLWDKYLSSLVGNQVHMSTHGRQINFWQYGTSLGRLGTADVADFVDFPNIVKTGDETCTSAAVQVGTATLTAFSGNAGEYTIAVGEGPAVSSAFYVGQQIESDSALVMSIGTQFRIAGVTVIAGPPVRYFYNIYFDNPLLTNINQGSQIKGEVFGLAGGKHPTLPLLVERFRSEPDVVGRDQAQQIAASMLQLTAPFDTLDTDVYKAAVTQHSPWEFSTLIPGQTALITSLLGPLVLQVAAVGGAWSSNESGVVALDLHVGLRTVPQAPFVPTPSATYTAYLSNDAPPVNGTLISLKLDDRARRRRRHAGEDDLAAIRVTAPNRPTAIFFPPCTFMPIDNGTDETAILAGTGAISTASVSDNQWDLWRLAAVAGTSG